MAAQSGVLVTIPGVIEADAFHFSLPIGRFGQFQPVPFVLDTGAFELTFNESTAVLLGLPNLGSTQIQGVSGAATVYRSQVGIQLGNREFRGTRCLVDPSLQGDSLFGLRFVAFYKLGLLLDTRALTLTFLS